MWQDYTIAVVVAIFTLTTLPMIRSGVKLPLWTTVPMVVGGLVLLLTYMTMDLWYSVGVEWISLIGWTILMSRSFKRV